MSIQAKESRPELGYLSHPLENSLDANYSIVSPYLKSKLETRRPDHSSIVPLMRLRTLPVTGAWFVCMYVETSPKVPVTRPCAESQTWCRSGV